MYFYKNLYVGSSIKDPDEVRRNLLIGKGQFSIYVITLSPSRPRPGANQLEILHCALLKTPYYRENPPFIIGIADGKSVSIPAKTFASADTDIIAKKVSDFASAIDYSFFSGNIDLFIRANQHRLAYLKDEACVFVRKAASKYKEENIVISFSGGKDSTTLLMGLKNLQRFYPKKFEIIAVTVNPGFDGFDSSKLQNLCKELDVKFIEEQSHIKEIVFDIRNEKNPCSLCCAIQSGNPQCLR